MNDTQREPEFFRWIRAARRKHDKAVAGLTPEQRAEQAGREAVELAKAFKPVDPREARERLDALLAEPPPTPKNRSAKRATKKTSGNRKPALA